MRQCLGRNLSHRQDKGPMVRVPFDGRDDKRSEIRILFRKMNINISCAAGIRQLRKKVLKKVLDRLEPAPNYLNKINILFS